MKLMGILNVTPDSFSDGGRWTDGDVAIRHGLAMWAEGAALLDVGGESTRPGAAVVPPEAEAARVIPVIRALAAEGCHVSVDTRRASVAAAALRAGARWINDVSAGADPDMFAVMRDAEASVLMHMRGTPATMQAQAQYQDVVTEVITELSPRLAAAEAAGVRNLYVDPGIGFAKTLDHNLSLLRALPTFTRWRPTLLGASRKSFIGVLTGQSNAAERLEGSLAVALHAARCGVMVLRVHDVAATRRALTVWAALQEPPC